MQFDIKKIVIGVLLAGIFSMGFLITYLSLKTSNIFVKKVIPTPSPNTFTSSTPKPVVETNPTKGTYNILLMGYGGAGHDGAMLTDSMIVIHIDTNTHKVSFVSVPRDLWIPGNVKVNSVATSNGFSAVGPAVTNVIGLPINYFVSINFGSFIKLIDNIGGITANTPTAFEDKFYPITGEENNTCGMTNDQIDALKTKFTGYSLEIQFTCRYEDLKFNKGPVNLDGTTALKYVRSRHGDSDFGRSARQFAVLQGILQKLISIQSLGKLDSTIDILSKMVKTDLDLGTIKSLIQIFGDPKNYTFKNIQLTIDNVLVQSTSTDGQYILIPKAGTFNFSEIKNYISGSI